MAQRKEDSAHRRSVTLPRPLQPQGEIMKPEPFDRRAFLKRAAASRAAAVESTLPQNPPRQQATPGATHQLPAISPELYRTGPDGHVEA
jgi:hypothetical protein